MTEEELREKGRELLLNNIAVFKCSNTAYANAYLYEQLADDLFYKILTLIREAGWKSPDRIPNATICPKCNEMHWIK
jgi:hypothetical protein